MTTFYLITSASQQSAEDGTLNRLLSSVLASKRVHVYCVARGWRTETRREVVSRHGPALMIIDSSAELSTSGSRNLALLQLAKASPARRSIVGFPDDDCWYLDDTLEQVASAFVDRPDAAVVTGCYAPTRDQVDRSRFPEHAKNLNARAAVRLVSSVTFFARTEHVLSVGGFNPALGLGTPAVVAGEDADYVLRLIEAGLVVAYRPEIVVGHPYKRDTTTPQFGPFFVVLASHLTRSPSLALPLLRGVLGTARVLLLGLVGSPRRCLEARRRLNELSQLRLATIRRVRNSRFDIDT